MVREALLLLALTLCACAEPPAGAMMVAGSTSVTLPPDRSLDCVSYVLVDDKCTVDWYHCRSPSDDDRACVRAWRECCEIPGQGSRSRLGSVETLPRD